MEARINVLNVNLMALPGEPDYMNNTTIFVNNVTLWPTPYGEERLERPFDDIREGDELSISVPSGTLTGIVVNAEHAEPKPWCRPLIRVVLTDVEWDGKHAGLANGCCGVGEWYFYESATIKTSVADDLTNYADYLLVRRLAEHVKDCYGFPEEKQELLRKAWVAVKKLREEANI